MEERDGEWGGGIEGEEGGSGWGERGEMEGGVVGGGRV